MDRSALVDQLSEFARALSVTYDVNEMLDLVGRHVVRALNVQGAGVTITDPANGQTRHLTATDPATLHIEKVQAELREGPCVVAMQRGEIVAIGDITQVEHWDRYRSEVLGAGMTSVMGVPLKTDDQIIGALNVYDRRPEPWPDDQQRMAQLLADIAAWWVARHQALEEAAKLNDQLQHALDSRVRIEQAKGVLAERHGVSVDEAFARIRAYARHARLKLQDVAGEIVAGELDV